MEPTGPPVSAELCSLLSSRKDPSCCFPDHFLSRLSLLWFGWLVAMAAAGGGPAPGDLFAHIDKPGQKEA